MTHDWSIHLAHAGRGTYDERLLEHLADALTPHAGITTGSPSVGASSWGARITVAAEDALQAIAAASAIVEAAGRAVPLPPWPIVAIDLLRDDALSVYLNR